MTSRSIAGHSWLIKDTLRRENFKKFAEIGIWKSRTTRRILRGEEAANIDEYWAIDPWDINLAFTRTEKRRSEDDWNGLHRYCCSLMIYFPQLRVLRLTSEQASTLFPNGS